MKDVLEELEALSIKEHGELLDVCEAWVVHALLVRSIQKGLITYRQARVYTWRLNQAMVRVGTFPISVPTKQDVQDYREELETN